MLRKQLILGTTALVFSLGLQAHDSDYRDRDRYRRDSRYSNYGSPASRIISDLREIGSRSRVDHHERKHFERAAKELYKFDERLRDGRFDRGALNRAIEDLEHLSRAEQIHPRYRRVLDQDLDLLYRFRDNRDYGARYRDGHGHDGYRSGGSRYPRY